MYPKGISIIIPCFNRQSTIASCVESIILQNYEGNLEIIISDDGSSDSSLEVAEKLDKRVKIIKKPITCVDQGASGARNRGLIIAKYEYICFLDSDDYFLPDYLQTASTFLNNNKNIGYTFCRSRKEVRLAGGSVKIEDWTRAHLSKLDKNYHVFYRPRNINTNVIMIRKKVLDSCGLFDTLLLNGNDTDMWFRVSEVSKGHFLDIYGAVYRVNHSEKQLTGNSEEIKEKSRMRIYSNAVQRFIESKSKDKLRLFLLIRALFYINLPRKYKSFRLLSHLIVSGKLFLNLPLTFFRFIAAAIR